MGIHPTSVISPESKVSPEAVIGPFCVVQGKVEIGKGTVLESHVSVGNEFGTVILGAHNRISPGAVVGGPPQDLKYAGEDTKLILGDNNVIREAVTLNTGTPGGGGVTQIGNNCLIMAYSHVAHDCFLEDRVVIANSCQLAGHVEIESDVKIGGVCCINQFVKIGRHAYIAGDSAVNKDIPPFAIAQGKYAVIRATNKIGMERAGIDKTIVNDIHKAIRAITKGTETVEEVLSRVETEFDTSKELTQFIEFVKSSERGIAK